MTTVFIAGSITIKTLDARVKERLAKVIASGADIVVGDADGVDSVLQRQLFDANVQNVTVFCAGDTPRNNIGDWPVRAVATHHSAGTRAYFTAKDLCMAECADFGLMIWDSKSTGTLSNVIELLTREKKSVIYVNKDKVFRNVGSVQDLETLVACMSESAKLKADDKIQLSDRISGLKQTALFV